MATARGTLALSRSLLASALVLGATGCGGGDDAARPKPFSSIYVADVGSASVKGWDSARTVDGDVAPTRTVSGASTGLSGPYGVTYDSRSGTLVVGDNAEAVRFYANVRTTNGDVAPSRVVTGASTLLNNGYDVAVDEGRNLLYVTTSGGVLVFTGASTIDEGADMAVDSVSDMLYVTTGANVLVWHGASTKTGDVAPDRTIAGASTGFSRPVDIVGVR